MQTSALDPVDITVTCIECSKTWETTVPRAFSHKTYAICDKCQAERVTRNLEKRWFEICPKRYQRFDPERFTGNQEKLDEAREWQWEINGLVLHGYTGQGKTWAAMLIGRREFLAGRTVEIVDDFLLCRLITAKGLSMESYHSALSRICSRDLVILDDPFKGTLTESTQGALWTIINERYNQARPNIVTMNGTSENIEPLLTDDRAKPLFQRLRTTSKIIHFPKP